MQNIKYVGAVTAIVLAMSATNLVSAQVTPGIDGATNTPSSNNSGGDSSVGTQNDTDGSGSSDGSDVSGTDWNSDSGSVDSTMNDINTTQTTPGVPNSGAGGDARENLLVITLSVIGVVLGAMLLARERALAK